MLGLWQVRNTPHVNWEALAEMCRSAIRKSENLPNYRAAIHRTIILKCHSDLQCLPIPMRNMPAAISVPSTLLKHVVKCMFPQGSLVQHALPQCIWDMESVHSSSVSEQVVSNVQVSIPTTFWSSRTLQFGSSALPHPVEHRGLPSRWHVSNSSQRNTVPRRCAFPSQSCPLDHQAQLKTAPGSENTSHRVNGILALQWFEVCIQFSHWLQVTSPHYCLSCSNQTHQKSQNSMSSVRVGRCVMVSLSMLRYHTTEGGYSFGFPPNQYRCSDNHGWDSHFLCATSQCVWTQFHILSHWWHSWMSLQLRALSLPGLVPGLMYALDAPVVELTGSLKGGEAQNSVSAMDTTPICHW